MLENYNRKFQYGDGFFETIIVNKGIILFFEDHLKRIEYASNTLKINLSPSFSVNLEKNIISKSIFSNTRVKVQFWRKGEGRYTPQTNEIEYSVEVYENKLPFIREEAKIDFCKSSSIISSKFSSFKCFLLPYIIAGIEKKEKNTSDLILLNEKNEITETISSNIFWVKNKTFYTPNLNTGCINGIMRKQIITILKSNNISIREGFFKMNEIKNSDFIITTNVTGISIYNNSIHDFVNDYSFFRKLNEL